ncbi:MAG TPA: heavy-metal-associated domain-containing protein [Nocardioidaceae bacterium]|nr:heavy-metal-associated domain-containing protein [Nocardioidaceae bacterium]
MSTTRYQVEGMTCEHCVASVKEEVGALPGVSAVEVELVTGGRSTVSVEAAGPLTDAQVREAVAEAGYTLVGASA